MRLTSQPDLLIRQLHKTLNKNHESRFFIWSIPLYLAQPLSLAEDNILGLYILLVGLYNSRLWRIFQDYNNYHDAFHKEDLPCKYYDNQQKQLKRTIILQTNGDLILVTLKRKVHGVLWPKQTVTIPSVLRSSSDRFNSKYY